MTKSLHHPSSGMYSSPYLSSTLLLFILLITTPSLSHIRVGLFVLGQDPSIIITLPYCSVFSVSPNNVVIPSGSSLTLTVSHANDLYMPTLSATSSISQLDATSFASSAKNCFYLVNTASQYDALSASDVRATSSKIMSVVFNTVGTNKQYSLRIGTCFAYTRRVMDSVIEFIPLPVTVIHGYSTGTKVALTYSPSISADTLFASTCMANIPNKVLSYQSMIGSVITPSNIVNDPTIDMTLGTHGKLILGGTWNAENLDVLLNDVIYHGYNYKFLKGIHIEMRKPNVTLLKIPLKFKRHISAASEWVTLDSFEVLPRRAADPSELELLFNNYFVDGSVSDIQVTIDPNTAPVSIADATGAAAVTDVNVLLTYNYYQATFYDVDSNPTYQFTVSDGILTNFLLTQYATLFSCGLKRRRNMYQYYAPTVYHFIGYSSHHRMLSFDITNKWYDLGAAINTTSQMFSQSTVIVSDFVNTNTKTQDGIKVTLMESAATDYDASFYSQNYLVSIPHHKEALATSPLEFTILDSTDMEAGILITQEDFQMKYQMDPTAFCNQDFNTDIGYQLKYFFESYDHTITKLPEYSPRLNFSTNSVSLGTDHNSLEMSYSNLGYFQDFAIEIDMTKIQFMEPRITSTDVSFSVIPDTTPFFETNATIAINITNSGDVEGTFVFDLTCMDPISIVDAQGGHRVLTISEKATSSVLIPVTSAIINSLQYVPCSVSIQINREELWSYSDKSVTVQQNITIDHGYFIPRCQARYYEPFVFVENVELVKPDFTRNSSLFFTNIVRVQLKSNGSDPISANVKAALASLADNPFQTYDQYWVNLSPTHNHAFLNFTIHSDAATQILTERLNKKMYTFVLNISLLDDYVCWSQVGKGGLFNFLFHVEYDCPSGYTDTLCDMPICFNHNASDNETCSSHGRCVLPDTCICDENYISENCSIPVCFLIAANHSNSCHGQGICQSANNCSCFDGFTGNECEIPKCFGIPAGTPLVCSGHGTCLHKDNCSCDSGYVSENCSLPVCFGHNSSSPQACSSHGVCQSPNNCSCDENYVSSNCSIPVCYGIRADNFTHVCSARGECLDANNCQCREGYLGKNCSLSLCFNVPSNDSSVCSSHGVCQDYNLCQCFEGYVSENCSEPVCFGVNATSPLVCTYHGNCVSPNVCECHENYISENCSIPVCFGVAGNESHTCSRHGECMSANNCSCDEGYTGENCEIPICFGVLSNDSLRVCSYHGECVAFNNCSCHAGYISHDCSEPVCFGHNATSPLVCSTHGECIAPNNCSCFDGYVSENCSIPLCFNIRADNYSNVCSGHGLCQDFNKCHCDIGYVSQNCSEPVCFGVNATSTLVCSSHGQCISPNSCECHENYISENCSIPVCFGVAGNESHTCSAHGQCMSPNNCSCDEGYTGDNCEIAICYGFLSNDSLRVCSNHGECVAFNNCSCRPGYISHDCSEPVCFGHNATSPLVCSTHGECISPNNCSCFEGYVSENCSIPLCFNIRADNFSHVCSGHGLCQDYNDCLCADGYVSRNCSEPVCFGWNATSTLVCSNHGTCVSPIHVSVTRITFLKIVPFLFVLEWLAMKVKPAQDMVSVRMPIIVHVMKVTQVKIVKFQFAMAYYPMTLCVCSPGYISHDCSEPVCFGHNATSPLTCSSHGECIAPNNCSCFDGYVSENCSIPLCFDIRADNYSIVCSGHGICQDFNKCHCDIGYVSQNCSEPVCFGINATSPHVCSSHGRCVAPDECLCASNYTSPNCSIPLCFGKRADDPSVCSSHGQCLEPNSCSCKMGTYGSTCEISDCFGILSNQSNVCNGNGICTDYNFCECFSNFTGQTCTISACYGFASNDSRVCSGGRGDCLGPNQCQCHPKYHGNNCEISTCFGMLSNQTQLVCSGNGQCVDTDICNCTANYVDATCSTPVCFGLNASHPNVCSSHGECVAPNRCSCSSDYSSENCSIPTCFGIRADNFSHVCSGHGICVDVNTCQCTEGYTSQNCSEPVCFGYNATHAQVCNSHGRCLSPDVCECDDNYISENCSIPVCFGIAANHSNSCHGQGICQSANHCSCFDGFTGINCSIPICFGIQADHHSEVCSSHGECIAPNNCSCMTGYTSNNCSVPICFGIMRVNTCSSHGHCVAPNQCECQQGYIGLECEIALCYGIPSNDTARTCSGHGLCTSFNHCTCDAFFEGANCEQYNETTNTIPCPQNNGLVCSGNGQCRSNGTCQCHEGYTSQNCSEPVCFGYNATHAQVCNSHGRCLSPDVCKCDDNYISENCSIPVCFGISANHSNSCHGQGICESANHCHCHDGFYGPQCDLVTCFGIRSDHESEVCSGRGNCSQTNTCQCENNYFGANCNITTCNDISSNSSEMVCNGRGICSSYDTCTCKGGYYGKWCEMALCNASSCIHGHCEGSSFCQCDSHWIGDSCTIPTCFGKSASDSSTCSGNGNCTDVDTCNCTFNYKGMQCEILQIGADECNIYPFMTLKESEWFPKSLNFDFTTSQPNMTSHVIRDTIPYSSLLHLNNKFNYQLSVENKGKRPLQFRIQSYCKESGSFKQLGVPSIHEQKELSQYSTLTLEDTDSFGFGFYFTRSQFNKLENITCYIHAEFIPSGMFESCQNADQSHQSFKQIHNISIIFENVNSCQFIDEEDVSSHYIDSTTLAKTFEQYEPIFKELLLQSSTNENSTANNYLQSNSSSSSIIEIMNIFTQKRNNWVISSSNENNNSSMLAANLLLTVQVSNMENQFGTFLPTLYCKDERIMCGLEFTEQYRKTQPPIVLYNDVKRTFFQFNVTILNFTASIDFGRVKGGKEGIATVSIDDMDLNCTLFLIPNPEACWLSQTTSQQEITKRHTLFEHDFKKHLFERLISKFKLPIVSGEFTFLQEVRPFEIGVVALTYTCMSLGFASILCGTKIPRDRKHSLLQLVDFVNEKTRKKLLAKFNKDAQRQSENEPIVTEFLCENCGHRTLKKAKYTIQVESYQKEVSFNVCENQICFDALSSIHNVNYSNCYKCFDCETGLELNEAPFYGINLDHNNSSDMIPPMMSQSILFSSNNVGVIHEGDDHTMMQQWNHDENQQVIGLLYGGEAGEEDDDHPILYTA
ncbi:hypothetical protein C9374_004025 [Naegleria lovaniensis]|uniref:EGF-like domain-containing protein n=1 Tax=Naegleria lovaniensis TaxID=51637 RepID=A0AA88H649_NAELO|nr:uncharacterized protein C9374_004025 [Naegleria lovaniensis]KAG2394261.1 hypothetical protein C9374_004025 [Naegleria lovaniensis]